MSAQREPREGSATIEAAPILARVSGLTVSFPGNPTPAVDELSLTIRAGECVALVGESGSGKSLTARALLGLLPERALVSGTIELATPELRPAPAAGASAWNAVRGALAALIPQDALGGLDPLRRLEHEVGDALRLHGGGSRHERRSRVVAALHSAGMPEPERRLRQRSDELSGGLRQRALVASAFIAEPALIIADEPTTALDAGHRGRVLAQIGDRVRAGAGALLISHDLASVREIADRVLVMRAGRVVEQGETNRVFAEPGHPFTRELLAAVPASTPRGERLVSPSRSANEQRPATASPERLRLRDIDVAFGSGAHSRHVLEGASLHVDRGETVGLLGESGSGKTTLLRVALGLQSPDAGAILVDGIDRERAPRRQRRSLRRRLALVPQDPLDSFPRGTNGTRLLADALRAAGVPRGERHARSISLAEEVGLGVEELLRPAATLSGGQRQRLAIARALALEPEILLLDEPVSALDLTVQARVLDLLDDLQERRGTAYLFVSHDEDVIRHMSDQVLRLDGGRLIAEETGSFPAPRERRVGGV